MASIKMTVRSIDAIRPPVSGQLDYWDADHPGFGLRVSAGGRKAWVAMYRHGNVKRRLTLGTYPALSLAEAREKAGAAHHTVQYEGTDPAAAKKADRAAETLAELAADYIERHAKRQKRTWRKDALILEKDALPRFGKRKAKDINRRDIVEMLDEIVGRGAPIQANRTLEIVRKMFNWAVARDILDANPCYRVSKPSRENRSDRVLTA
jgi:Arm DNA-binding domain/Phage integrase central domain